ncbi:MAG: bacterial transcriptional activator domain-containing protein [Caldilineaceae bacterium]
MAGGSPLAGHAPAGPTGQRAAAEAQYQRCRQVMADELGVEPDAETTALYEQIRAGKLGRVTSDKVTSDKVTSTSSVTESPNHPITLSPSHPSPCHGRPALSAIGPKCRRSISLSNGAPR